MVSTGRRYIAGHLADGQAALSTAQTEDAKSIRSKIAQVFTFPKVQARPVCAAA